MPRANFWTQQRSTKLQPKQNNRHHNWLVVSAQMTKMSFSGDHHHDRNNKMPKHFKPQKFAIGTQPLKGTWPQTIPCGTGGNQDELLVTSDLDGIAAMSEKRIHVAAILCDPTVLSLRVQTWCRGLARDMPMFRKNAAAATGKAGKRRKCDQATTWIIIHIDRTLLLSDSFCATVAHELPILRCLDRKIVKM